MSTNLQDHIEKIQFENCTGLHIKLGGLSEDQTIQLIELIKGEILMFSGFFVTVYNYNGFVVTPRSKKAAKELKQFVDDTKRSKGTIAYGADYFVRLIGSIIRPSTIFVSNKEKALEGLNYLCSF